MVSRIVTKMGLDTTSGVLIGIGTAGLTIAVYNGQVIPGIFGTIALIIGLGLRIFRTVWNEKTKEELEWELQRW